uniref:C2 domain-containing protein n=1 Tax=Myotis lucifugus TaxID=59463 RepID=G1PNY6_MYOLU
MRLLGKLRASATGSAASEPAFSNVLTPGRIPEFCIPPRLSAPCAPDSPPPAAAVPRRCAAEPDLWPRGADDGAGRTDWDPRSQAALSLPHLPRARTAYGFCALLESPHTRRKESLFLGGPGAAALLQPPVLRPRAHTYGGGGDVPLGFPSGAPGPAAPGDTLPPRNTLALRPRGHRLLRATGRAIEPRAAGPEESRLTAPLGVSKTRTLASSGSPARTCSASPPSDAGPRPELLEAEGTVALGRAGGALRLAAEYSPASGRLRLRLLSPEGPAGGASDPCAVGCRVSLVLPPPGKTRQQRSAVVRRSRKAVFDQDFCFEGLSEDEVRRLAVRVKAEDKGRGLKRGRLLGQGELLLGSLLLL